ncbi:predicted protein [Aspergillus nidulans FGSC A4]|uniref:Uncharacterized protein n=1 Tax=Emericella nidulans (strain FGSC A4 / ATCC 38163 / CBS 112.46 / NRRL 194 / M139) TaxID=227321 RepID=Q5B1J8_EMENI|nr:hypothetical protein [Aspergillus nidulans FGSC A4]EAA62225.1 predicted protein [Aspergillus nidulans FGSC A4]CBF81623.1 TPA: conserved hypothetical protein [Aspergillus nidulans FGSC A4]|eukprot:XP_663186.1 predicted protein [Aspergillus nidulans FGSC A4]
MSRSLQSNRNDDWDCYQMASVGERLEALGREASSVRVHGYSARHMPPIVGGTSARTIYRGPEQPPSILLSLGPFQVVAIPPCCTFLLQSQPSSLPDCEARDRTKVAEYKVANGTLSLSLNLNLSPSRSVSVRLDQSHSVFGLAVLYEDSEVNRYWYQNLRVGRDVEAALGFSIDKASQIATTEWEQQNGLTRHSAYILWLALPSLRTEAIHELPNHICRKSNQHTKISGDVPMANGFLSVGMKADVWPEKSSLTNRQ